MRQRGDMQILPDDPLMEEVDELLQSPMSYEVRGSRALNQGDWTAAAAYFRKGVALAPTNPALRHKLGTALFQMGKPREALEQFQETVRVSPTYAKAHYSLGVLMEAGGRTKDAIERFSAAARYDPSYVEARLRLADLLRRSGQAQASVMQYELLRRIDPRVSEAALGYAMALVNLGRYQEARDRLTQAITVYRDQPLFTHALARLLATAPDDRVRDGRRALSLTQELLKRYQTLELGETMAMALAELGQYREAAAFEREVMTAAKQAGRQELMQRMTDNLALYEHDKPCRVPWSQDDPVEAFQFAR